MYRKLKIGLTGLCALIFLGYASLAFAGDEMLINTHGHNHMSMVNHDTDINFDDEDDDDDDWDKEDEEEGVDDFEFEDDHEHELEMQEMHTSHSMSITGNGNGGSDHSRMGHSSTLHQQIAATHTAATSGSWSKASTWQEGTIPTDHSIVSIPAGVEVTIDGKVTARVKQVSIDGTLRFATAVDTELWVDTITSGQTGRLEIGTAANPIAADVTARIVFVDNGKIDRQMDPTQVGRGAILSGPTVVHGAPKTHRLTVATFPKAGDTLLQLSSPPTGWRVGDQLIITGSQGKTSDELRSITGINGTSISLDQPLALDHIPPKADLNLWVANGTRNVIFESESLDTLHRGHIMLMHNLDVDIQNARFYGLGRTDKTIPLDDFEYAFDESPANEGPSPINFSLIPGPANNIRGRYPIHFHRGGTAPGSRPAVVKGSVLEDSPGWGYVNHSSNVDFIDNVSYNVQGAGFYTEAGDEVGSMVGNIAIRSVNSSFILDDEGAIDPDLGLDRGDFGNDGDGFWLSGTRVSVIDNVAAGASAHGIIFWVDGLIEPDTGRATVQTSEIENGHLISGRDTIPVWWAPLADVRNNEAYGATVGFRSRYIHSDFYMGESESAFHEKPPQAYVDTLNPVFDGITVWDSRDGILLNYNERLSVKNARLIGIGHSFDHNLGLTAAVGVGLDLNNEATFGPGVVDNISIEGYEMGFIAPRQGNWSINDMDLRNLTDILIHEPKVEPRTMPMTNIEFGSLSGTAVEGKGGQRQHIVLQMELDYTFNDPYLLLAPDTVTLDGREIYYDQQRPDYIPYTDEFDVEIDDQSLDEGYRNKTNQQLWDTYGQALAGELMPSSAVNDPAIIGGKIDPGGAIEQPPVETPNPVATPVPQPTITPDVDPDMEDEEEEENDPDEDEDEGSDLNQGDEYDLFVPFFEWGEMFRSRIYDSALGEWLEDFEEEDE